MTSYNAVFYGANLERFPLYENVIKHAMKDNGHTGCKIVVTGPQSSQVCEYLKERFGEVVSLWMVQPSAGQSAAAIAARLLETKVGHLNLVVVNPAAFLVVNAVPADTYFVECVYEFMEVAEKLLPRLAPGGRFVNLTVPYIVPQFQKCSHKIQKMLLSSKFDRELMQGLVHRYSEAIRSMSYDMDGWSKDYVVMTHVFIYAAMLMISRSRKLALEVASSSAAEQPGTSSSTTILPILLYSVAPNKFPHMISGASEAHTLLMSETIVGAFSKPEKISGSLLIGQHAVPLNSNPEELKKLMQCVEESDWSWSLTEYMTNPLARNDSSQYTSVVGGADPEKWSSRASFMSYNEDEAKCDWPACSCSNCANCADSCHCPTKPCKDCQCGCQLCRCEKCTCTAKRACRDCKCEGCNCGRTASSRAAESVSAGKACVCRRCCFNETDGSTRSRKLGCNCANSQEVLKTATSEQVIPSNQQNGTGYASTATELRTSQSATTHMSAGFAYKATGGSNTFSTVENTQANQQGPVSAGIKETTSISKTTTSRETTTNAEKPQVPVVTQSRTEQKTTTSTLLPAGLGDNRVVNEFKSLRTLSPLASAFPSAITLSVGVSPNNSNAPHAYNFPLKPNHPQGQAMAQSPLSGMQLAGFPAVVSPAAHLTYGGRPAAELTSTMNTAVQQTAQASNYVNTTDTVYYKETSRTTNTTQQPTAQTGQVNTSVMTVMADSNQPQTISSSTQQRTHTSNEGSTHLSTAQVVPSSINYQGQTTTTTTYHTSRPTQPTSTINAAQPSVNTQYTSQTGAWTGEWTGASANVNSMQYSQTTTQDARISTRPAETATQVSSTTGTVDIAELAKAVRTDEASVCGFYSVRSVRYVSSLEGGSTSSKFVVSEHRLKSSPYCRLMVNIKYVSVDPWMLERTLSDGTLQCMCVATVVTSTDSAWRAGDYIVDNMPWYEGYFEFSPSTYARKVESRYQPEAYLAAYSYYGFMAQRCLEQCEAQFGKTVIVNDCTNPIAQLACLTAKRVLNMTVIAVASDSSVCKMLKEQVGVDACIDSSACTATCDLATAEGQASAYTKYLNELQIVFAQTGKGHADCVIESVGGYQLDAHLALLHERTRVAFCDNVSNQVGYHYGYKNLDNLIKTSSTISGFGKKTFGNEKAAASEEEWKTKMDSYYASIDRMMAQRNLTVPVQCTDCSNMCEGALPVLESLLVQRNGGSYCLRIRI